MLSLNGLRTTWAIGNAGTQASGLWEFLTENAMSKQLHPAKAAVNGMLAAFLARRGFTGASSIYEGEKGFFRATSMDFNPEVATEGLGIGHYAIDQCSIKKHASCGHTHSAVDAVLDLVTQHAISPENIEHIDVRLYDQALDLLEKIKPTSPFFEKFCLPFCIATAAIYRQVGLDAFTEKRLEDPAILRLMDCISLRRDPELTPLFPEKYCAVVTLKTRKGEMLTARIEDPRERPKIQCLPARLSRNIGK